MQSALWIAALAPPVALVQEGPRTVPEASGFERTSTLADVRSFLDRLRELPAAGRIDVRTFGASEEGRDLVLVTASEPPLAGDAALSASEKLRVLVNANIHGGEVEGKEAVQALLREIAQGGHEDLLRHAVVFFVPIYNVDGNERIDPRNRRSQNGPDAGVGARANAQGLDLNRDFVKAESAECRALLALFRRLDPHVFVDLHTTDGSHHGYHLTYAPSLSTSVDPELDRLARGTLLAEVRRACAEEHGVRAFDYGNFARGEPPDRRGWETYDHRPRFGTNYYGLRGRIGILSEAYSNLDFRGRVDATRAFTLEVLRAAVQHREAILEQCRAADERAARGEFALAYDTALAAGHAGEVLVGDVVERELEGGGRRFEATDAFRAERMLVRVAFESHSRRAAPGAWAVRAPSAALREALAHHGVEARELGAEARVEAWSFAVSAVERAERPFQGHREVALAGEWARGTHALEAGTLVVPAGQRLGRLAAHLLEPESEDSLATWGFFEVGAGEGFPVLRLDGLEGLELGQ